MSEQQNLTKEQLIKVIEQLEKNPNDRSGILGDVGVTALGAAGAGVAAAFFGATTAYIPIIGVTLAVAAAPVTLVAGAAVAGGAAVYGVSRLIKDGGFNEGKRKQLLNEYKEKLREVEAKERQSNFDEHDKTRFYSFLKEPLKHNLISPDDAQQLMQAVEKGHIPLSEAYKLVGQVLSDSQTAGQFLSDSQTREPEKVITPCPNCSQKLRAPSHLGQVNLTCPKCKHSWLWVPK
ncbi:hypothetical protein NDI37_08325 [Funiculus sociatus GB2-A5]|uniref:Uncharacterized protein n=1 Tax=Funiculus sociatus GB2-A5 TaxID=2933946 RepID=A0ABV0JM23_9CYAN|nr:MULTISPECIES: hypothetical protein [unclassified Trichocoleus]MBD1907244.1 hypothetical protein [Trichocoleus sp. FACHB-832]MBD2064287.1 hypothetical protein [Trichocoleus sp. FACHB-6]